MLATTPVRTSTGGAHGPVVDSEAVLRDMVTARPDFYIHTTNFESVRSMLHLNFSKCPLENKSPVHTGQHFSTPNFHVSKPTLENERPSQTVQHFSIPHLLKLSISFIIFIPVFHCDKISGLRLHNGMMSSRKNIQKQCPDLRPRNGMMSPPKTPTIIPVS